MNEEHKHSYAIRKLYGTLKDKGFVGDELRQVVKRLASSKGEWNIGRCTTEQIEELYNEVNSTIDFKSLLGGLK